MSRSRDGGHPPTSRPSGKRSRPASGWPGEIAPSTSSTGGTAASASGTVTVATPSRLAARTHPRPLLSSNGWLRAGSHERASGFGPWSARLQAPLRRGLFHLSLDTRRRPSGCAGRSSPPIAVRRSRRSGWPARFPPVSSSPGRRCRWRSPRAGCRRYLWEGTKWMVSTIWSIRSGFHPQEVPSSW